MVSPNAQNKATSQDAMHEDIRVDTISKYSPFFGNWWPYGTVALGQAGAEFMARSLEYISRQNTHPQ